LRNDAARLVADRLAGAGRACITCSFQAEDVAVLHMLLRVNPDIPVLFLDTVHHFAQTYAYRDELAGRWRLNLINLRAAEPAPGLWQTSTDACCAKSWPHDRESPALMLVSLQIKNASHGRSS
jgi:phosphoadenosine phosphosulfate reductase